LFTISGAPSDITETAIKNGYDKLSKQQKDMLSDLRNAQGRPFSNLSDLFNFNQHRYGVRGPEGSIQVFELLPLLSRFNHSCLPNAVIGSTATAVARDGAQVLRAVKDIAKGDEITFCYDPAFFPFMISEFRRQVTRICCGFDCQCTACCPGTSFNEASDLRRHLLRAIEFRTTRKDPLEKANVEVPPLRMIESPSPFVLTLVTGQNPDGYIQLMSLKNMLVAAEGLPEQ